MTPSSIDRRSTIDYTYDPPYCLTAADYSTGDFYHYAYDSVGNRLTQDSSVHGLSSSVSYNYDIANRLADVDGVPYVYDANGNLLNDGQNTYTYDSANRLTSVLGPSSSVTYGYNGFGRKDSMIDPDMGSWSYTYDVFGNLTNQADARGCGTTITYDDLNRPEGKTYSGPGACDSTPDVTYSYDSTASGNEGIGHRTGMTDGSGSASWTYNALGQPTNQSQTIDSTNYQLASTFDAFSRPLTQTLPSSEVLNYSYNAMGALSSLSGTSTYVSQVHYAASGQVNDQTLGNGLLQQSCYETNTLRLSGLRVYSGSLQSCGTNPSSPKLNLSYAYQANGNVSQVVDSTRNETLQYTYDELDRLLSTSGPYNNNYSYNSIGNSIDQSVTPGFVAIATGNIHTCGVTTSGGVKCWGWNPRGQLGDGTTTQRTTPVDVSGLTSGVTATATGYYHTCALTSTGGVKCWGWNTIGQLGDGTKIQRTTPVDVTGLTSGVAAIVTGWYHTCALTTSGGVKCWGNNNDGQLGDGTRTYRLTPVDVSGLTSGVSAIATSGNHTCAVTTNGGVKCWGQNNYGQLGDGMTTRRLTPVDVSGLTSGVSAITAGGELFTAHTCALTSGGGAKCWGANLHGQLGDGTNTQRLTPVDVSGLTSGVATISTGNNHSCALTTSGGAKCWGSDGHGQLGDGSFTLFIRTTPVDVIGLSSGVTAVAAGGSYTCAIAAVGLKCWGNNNYGQLGNGVAINRTLPVDVSELSGATAVAAGYEHTCALTSSGGVKCWGRNNYSQLGVLFNMESYGTTSTPLDVTNLTSGVTAITTGFNHTCALTTGGGVKCWGNNSYGQLGNNTTIPNSSPVDVSGLTSGVSAIAANGYFTCALTTSGGVKCWGRNNYGQLGDGTTTQRLAPVDVSGLTSGVSAITAGSFTASDGMLVSAYACALTTSGGIKCWGNNSSGQLGDGTTTQRLTPVDVSGLTSGVTAISAGTGQTCALTTAGGAKCWGNNADGELGDGTTTQRLTPVDVNGQASGVTAIDAGDWHTCALTTSGSAKCWGWNSYGALGDGTDTDRITPVQVNGLTSGVTAISAGGYHTCALTTDGVPKCWGHDSYGQLGDGITLYHATPIDVVVPPDSTTTYSYGDSLHKYAVTSLFSGETYTYDANGNMITRVEGGVTYDQVFDAENRLVSVTTDGQTTEFLYDGDGNLVKKTNPNGSKTIYAAGGLYEVDKDSGGSVTRTVTYYPAGGAMRIDNTMYYNLKDHLGSASVMTDASGAVVGEQRYYPFGETRVTTGSMFTDQLFTGQREMTGLGIYHYGARFYSPKLGRFISADSIVPGASNPQAFNRYSYVLNNPLKYTDPTGHGQCRTREECEDMGTTPYNGNGRGGGKKGGGGRDEAPTTTPTYTPTTTPTYTPITTPSPTITPIITTTRGATITPTLIPTVIFIIPTATPTLVTRLKANINPTPNGGIPYVGPPPPILEFVFVVIPAIYIGAINDNQGDGAPGYGPFLGPLGDGLDVVLSLPEVWEKLNYVPSHDSSYVPTPGATPYISVPPMPVVAPTP